MLGTQAGDDLLRAGPVRHRLHAGDETALLDEQFMVDGGEDGLGHGALCRKRNGKQKQKRQPCWLAFLTMLYY